MCWKLGIVNMNFILGENEPKGCDLYMQIHLINYHASIEMYPFQLVFNLKTQIFLNLIYYQNFP